MTPSPRTSIIMPVYNAQDRVTLSIDSVLAQTDPDFELLVLIDGSPDDSSRVIAEYLQNRPDERVRVFDNPENRGVSAVRNQGLDEARGEWIAFLDSGDTMRPAFLETLHGYADKHGADMVGSLLSIVKAADGSVNDRTGIPTTEYTGDEAAISLLTAQGMTPYVSDKLVRASLFENIRFPAGIHRGEDALTTLALCRAARKVVMTDEVLNEYFMDSTGLTWGRITPLEESRRLMELQREILGDLFHTGPGKRAYDTSSVITYLNNAQQALFRNDATGRQVIADCRREIGWGQTLSAIRANKMFGAAAILLKVSPALYRRLYGAYVKRTYGL